MSADLCGSVVSREPIFVQIYLVPVFPTSILVFCPCGPLLPYSQSKEPGHRPLFPLVIPAPLSVPPSCSSPVISWVGHTSFLEYHEFYKSWSTKTYQLIGSLPRPLPPRVGVSPQVSAMLESLRPALPDRSAVCKYTNIPETIATGINSRNSQSYVYEINKTKWTKKYFAR